MEIRIVPTQPEHYEALTALEDVIFGSLPNDETFTPQMYAQQVARFPEGQFTALANRDGTWVVVGSTTTMRTDYQFDDDAYGYYFDFIGRGTLSTHNPEGQWLYGIAMAVHPDFRRLGIGRRMYEVRHQLVRALKLRGELVAGLIPGYDRYRDSLTVEEYVRRVVMGDVTDPTLTMQLRSGFEWVRLLYGYVHDPRSNDIVTLLKRKNFDP